MIIIHKIIRKISYILCRIYFALVGSSLRTCSYREGEQNVIVSLTTFPARFDIVADTIRTLLMQLTMPDKIIVWIDECIPLETLPDKMLELEAYGVEYVHIEGDFRPHKKYLEAVKQYPDDLIITVDDDVLYPPTFVGSMLRTHKKYPDAVCGRRVHRIVKNADGTLKGYNDWEGEYRKLRTPSKMLATTGVGGVLYPPGSLPEEAFNRENITKLCLAADDMWLKCMEIMNNTKVVWTPCIEESPELIEKVQKTSLMAENVGDSMNDFYLHQVMDYYNISSDDFSDD